MAIVAKVRYYLILPVRWHRLRRCVRLTLLPNNGEGEYHKKLGRGRSMTTSVLQTFLRTSLLDLGADDSRLNKLLAAASKLADEFARTPVSAIPVFLAAIKFNADECGDAFDRVAAAIEQEWNTYQSAFQSGNATTLYRAVALQALVEAIALQPALGTAVTLLLKNFSPWLQFGKGELVINILSDAAKQAFQAECAAEMADNPNARPLLTAAVKAPKVDRAALQKRLEAASGPSNRAGQPTENANGSWPNEGQPWSLNFSDHMTKILGDYFDFAISKAAEMDTKNHGAIATKFNGDSSADENHRHSTNLLWWRQALYSATAEVPYRELTSVDAAVYAVVDLSKLVPPACEPAVHSFLAEAILSLAPGKEMLGVGEILNADKRATELLLGLVENAPTAGLVMAALKQKDAAGVFVKPSLQVHEWAVWLLRELLALQAIELAEPIPEKADK